MKKEHQIKLQEDVFKYAWDKYKAIYTMEEIRKSLLVSLPTFFRRVKQNYDQRRSNIKKY